MSFHCQACILRRPSPVQQLSRDGDSPKVAELEAEEAVSLPSQSNSVKDAVPSFISGEASDIQGAAVFPTASTTVALTISKTTNQVSSLLSLPSDIIHNILEKIPTPIVDLSNPFSVLEHCSVIEPTSSAFLSKNLIAAHNSSSDSLALEAVTNLYLLQDLPQSPSQESPPPIQVSTLEVDLSSFKLTGKKET